MIYGVDVSQFQGTINWDALNAVSNFVMIRTAYGTMTDTEFATNQSEARRVQASAGPLGIGYYYYAYPTLLDAPTSAKYFLASIGELKPGEILALDLEGNVGTQPVAWSLDWLQVVEALTGIKALIYLNQSEVTSYDWQPVIGNGYALWLADYTGVKDSMGVDTPWGVTTMVQWTDTDVASGITGNVDGDTFNGDIKAFAAFGKPAPVVAPPVEAPIPPEPAVPTQTVGAPSSTASAPAPASRDQSSSTTSTPSGLAAEEQQVVNWLGTVFGGFVIKLVGLGAGYLLAHYSGSLHLNDFATSLAGYLVGSTVHDSQL